MKGDLAQTIGDFAILFALVALVIFILAGIALIVLWLL